MNTLLTITLNGTDVNPYHRMGLTQNPFPQIAKAELDAAMMQLNSLDGDPLRGRDDVRERLAGWAPWFVELCCARYRPGERVRFVVELPAGF